MCSALGACGGGAFPGRPVVSTAPPRSPGWVLGQAEGSGPRATPEKPAELPAGGGIAKPPQRVSFLPGWKRPLRDLFWGRGTGGGLTAVTLFV